MHIQELDTPALVIDLNIMDRNLRRISDYTRAHGLRLRPHTKTHKIPALARKQIELGAVGITVAKVGEAEVMLNARPDDLLIAYPVIGAVKLKRLMDVAGSARITVSVDSIEAARQLSEAAAAAERTIGALAEFDAGLGRVGVQPGPDLVELAKFIDGAKGLTFEGVAFYPGHIKAMDGNVHASLSSLGAMLCGVIADLRAAGLEAKIVSGGSTPTLMRSHEVACLNEIRPGTYIFNDRNTVECGSCGWEDCAASILLTVVSTSVKDQMIVDGGSKTFSSDRVATSGEATFGHVIDAPDAVFTKMNEEHGFVDMRRSRKQFRVGERVRIIPNHVCVAVNLHERIYGVRGEQVEEVWQVEGRGKLQ